MIPQMEIPPELRNIAETSVEQIKKAFDTYLNAAQQAASTIEGSLDAAQASAKEIGKKAIGFTETNVMASFEHMQRLVRAKDIQDLARIQTEFAQEQLRTVSEQTKELGIAAQQAMKFPPRV